MAADVFHRELVFVPNILQEDVKPLSAIDSALLGQETILVGVLDAQGTVAILDMLLEVMVKLDFPAFLGLVLDDGNGILSREVIPS